MANVAMTTRISMSVKALQLRNVWRPNGLKNFHAVSLFTPAIFVCRESPVGRVQPEFRRALVVRGEAQTKIEWVQDAMF